MKTGIINHCLVLIFSLFLCILSGCSKRSYEPYEPSSSSILTPKAPDIPRINGPEIYGVRPGSPFIFRIPCTGKRPVDFYAENLPAGLSLDNNTGIITGSIRGKGNYEVTVKAVNSEGEDSRRFTIAVGETLALTPPMGWNSWYIHYDRVSDSLMRQAADQMIESGMADYGYQYVNIDDCWMVKANSDDPEIGGTMRTENGKLLTNSRFPDMHSLADYMHERGLKAGLYISPGPTTCAGYTGSYGYEEQDARTFADWEFDFLKYDWCSYRRIVKPESTEDYIKPYRQMWNILQSLDRDIVLNLCQYGMGDVWEWGGSVGNCWRTTGDLGLERNRDLPGFYYIGMSNAQHWEFAGPGAWNDPDYILIGWVGDARRMGPGTPTTLTGDEQYSYMSMWCLMAAPLIFSGDIGKLDEFTLNVLCNNEVIAVDQDPMGKQAWILRQTDNELALVKDMQDGSKAVGLFNLGLSPAVMSVSWEDINISGRWNVRDLWIQKDIGKYRDVFPARVPGHGVVLIRISK